MKAKGHGKLGDSYCLEGPEKGEDNIMKKLWMACDRDDLKAHIKDAVSFDRLEGWINNADYVYDNILDLLCSSSMSNMDASLGGNICVVELLFL